VALAASTLREEMAVSGQRPLAASGQIPMAAGVPSRHSGQVNTIPWPDRPLGRGMRVGLISDQIAGTRPGPAGRSRRTEVRPGKGEWCEHRKTDDLTHYWLLDCEVYWRLSTQLGESAIAEPVNRSAN
jgi:hypothetical protein